MVVVESKTNIPSPGLSVLPAVTTSPHKELHCQWETLNSQPGVAATLKLPESGAGTIAPTPRPAINPVGYKESFIFFFPRDKARSISLEQIFLKGESSPLPPQYHWAHLTFPFMGIQRQTPTGSCEDSGFLAT